ncbi:hypothetical protein [Priestia endophytica]|uniref:Uncharacterized protein n=1 Tax=Priestia endophytica TaxID=135735 RepID=A0AAX1Q5K9_9BACI|nr:hypothetical protein [Priestia endophytica]MCM3537395.1 hypothetical protein [Priestia endophytica]RAS73279.1 hypothetical protein A3864_19250 [Priestia endophytica]
MKILDAKIINTAHGLETYLDLIENSEIKEIHLPTTNNPSYEIQFGIKYFLLKNEKYYDSHKNYFYICMSSDFSSTTLKETHIESLFAVKNKEERETTKKLLGEWFIKTHTYKESINKLINKIKTENHCTEVDNQNKAEKIKFLKKLLELTAEDLEDASIERHVELHI